MGAIMNKLFSGKSMLEVDHVQCCNNTTHDDDSDHGDTGVVYDGRINMVIRRILDTWPTDAHVEVHVRPVGREIIEPL